MALRLVCEHGTAKRVEYVTEISHKVIEHHLHNARRAMGLFGTTLHLYLNWDRWINEQTTTNTHQRAVARQTNPQGVQHEVY